MASSRRATPNRVSVVASQICIEKISRYVYIL